MAGRLLAIVLIPHTSAWNFARLDPRLTNPKFQLAPQTQGRLFSASRNETLRGIPPNTSSLGVVVLLEASNGPPSCHGTVVVNWAAC
jgi:hypothetical protein